MDLMNGRGWGKAVIEHSTLRPNAVTDALCSWSQRVFKAT
jgi:hypothetical protein